LDRNQLFNQRNLGNNPLSNNKNKGCFNSIGTVLWILLLIYTFSNSLPIFYFLLAVSVLWGITRFFFKDILGRIFTFIFIIVLVVYALSYVFKIGRDLIPDETKNGIVRVDPPRKGKKKPGTNERDLLSDKFIKWYDFANSNYQAEYSTSNCSFIASVQKHQEIVDSVNAENSIKYLNQVYLGFHKEVAGVNHYSAELTSKCRIGFVSPDQNEESNWDIVLCYQP